MVMSSSEFYFDYINNTRDGVKINQGLGVAFSECSEGQIFTLGMGGGDSPRQTWKKSQVCKHCLPTIFEKIVDIFGQTTNFW